MRARRRTRTPRILSLSRNRSRSRTPPRRNRRQSRHQRRRPFPCGPWRKKEDGDEESVSLNERTRREGGARAQPERDSVMASATRHTGLSRHRRSRRDSSPATESRTASAPAAQEARREQLRARSPIRGPRSCLPPVGDLTAVPPISPWMTSQPDAKDLNEMDRALTTCRTRPLPRLPRDHARSSFLHLASS